MSWKNIVARYFFGPLIVFFLSLSFSLSPSLSLSVLSFTLSHLVYVPTDANDVFVPSFNIYIVEPSLRSRLFHIHLFCYACVGWGNWFILVSGHGEHSFFGHVIYCVSSCKNTSICMSINVLKSKNRCSTDEKSC